MFREDYKRANDSIHVPDSLLNSIKAEIQDHDQGTDHMRSHKWMPVFVYSGAAVAVAALVLLIVRPFDLGRSKSESAVASAETAGGMYAANALFSEENNAAPILSDAVAESESAASDLIAVPSEAKRFDKADGDEDEYNPLYAVPDQTYDDIFAMIVPSYSKHAADLSSRRSVIIDQSVDSAIIEGSALLAFGQQYALPEGRSVRAIAQIGEQILIISEADDSVYVTSYTSEGFQGETRQSGTFLSYELKETTIFEDDNSLSVHNVLLVSSEYILDPASLEGSLPETFCPVISAANGTRVLAPDEITVLEAGNVYTVYHAVEAGDSLITLYVFAELSAE